MTTTIKHLAIIMDGNRRWARRRGLPIYRGHAAGVVALEKLIRACVKKSIPYVTVYGFSTENWGRSKVEVAGLIKIINAAIIKYTGLLDEVNWRIKFIGRIKDFPKTLQSTMAKAEQKLQTNQAGMLVVALGYGGRDELIRAVAKANRKSRVNEKEFSQYLDTTGMPDPDLVIRTGGVKRLSNFLLWQIAYSELYFTNTFWPAFTPKHLDAALREYSHRQRNFGK
ncbi:TPA: di-trans,poly-cis-decaprenylcistransferase [Patescibacteria group bacterium]|nr:di-trans,poly-cis-decaprenylcistransferase [Patescibacteria group bacterium]